MKNNFIYTLLAFATLFISCKKEETMPKVSYEQAQKKQEVKVETPKILLADLPIQMDGTSVLIHPIGEFSVADGISKSRYSSSGSDRVSFTVSNSSENEITGYLNNLKFQEIGSDSLHVLTDKSIVIERITYLKSIADKTKNQILVYVLADLDTNRDGKIDSNDIKTLYLSKIDGSNFTKISEDLTELIDWNVVESKNRLYFRTIEDTNKNGEFDKNDIIHYHFIDLNSKDWLLQNYSPI